MAFCLKRAPVPMWWELKNAVEQYGVLAVFGRDVLTVEEMESMTMTANVINAYRSMEHAKNFAEWSSANPKLSELITWATEVYKKSEWRTESK